MIKKTLSIIAVASLLLTASCKKESETPEIQKVDSSSNAAGKITTPEIAPKVVDPNAKYASMDFDKTEHDFGNIMQGDKVETIFAFTNNGEADLVIVSAKGSCGCTVPDYPKTPVKPGEKATMKVSFNSAGKKGHNKKTVTIHANTKSGEEKLTITADIALDPNKKVEPKMSHSRPTKSVINKQAIK